MSQRRMLSGQGPAPRRDAPRGRRAGDRYGGPRPRTRRGGTLRAGARRHPTKRPAAKRIWAPRPGRLSGRTTALLVVIAALALAYAYPLRVYLAQQAEIDRLVSSQAQQQQRIAALNEALSKWDDDEYVIAQARWRLKYVRPGEVAYIVLDDQASTGSSSNRPATGTGSWVGQVWSTIQAADGPGESGP